MATLTGSFTGPAVTASVAYAAGGKVTFGLDGEWPRALINAEVSQDGGATWTPIGFDYGIDGASRAADATADNLLTYGPAPGGVLSFGTTPRGAGTRIVTPPGAGLFRLRCVEFRSGWCNWTISA